MGNGANDDNSAPVAKDALVFMVVHINGSWKVPCAYFLVDGLEGQESPTFYGCAFKDCQTKG